jgi:hypothetical protein
MSSKIHTWQIEKGELRQVDTKLADLGRTEAYDLEAWIISNPPIIGRDLVIIGRQVQTKSGPLDLLGIDKQGNAVVVELKRDCLPREAVTQAIDYTSDVATWSMESLGEVCLKFTGKSLEDTLSESFPEENLENLNINESQRIILVGFSMEPALERMVTWLSESYGMGINVIILHYVVTSGGEELLTRTSLISEEVVEERAKQRKFTIPMSDEPGHYGEDELRKLLSKYLSQDMVSARRIKEVLLPVCLSTNRVQRDLLKDELVRHGEAEDTSKAGYILTAISSQMGMEKNDFLRQVIGYDYPTYSWEKDNYYIREEYHKLVSSILEQTNLEE